MRVARRPLWPFLFELAVILALGLAFVYAGSLIAATFTIVDNPKPGQVTATSGRAYLVRDWNPGQAVVTWDSTTRVLTIEPSCRVKEIVIPAGCNVKVTRR